MTFDHAFGIFAILLGFWFFVSAVKGAFTGEFDWHAKRRTTHYSRSQSLVKFYFVIFVHIVLFGVMIMRMGWWFYQR